MKIRNREARSRRTGGGGERNVDTAGEESFEGGLLEYPHYTRPAVWTDGLGVERAVPEVLLSGHHEKVRAWRLAEAERITRDRRPDLWSRYRAGRQVREY